MSKNNNKQKPLDEVVITRRFITDVSKITNDDAINPTLTVRTVVKEILTENPTTILTVVDDKKTYDLNKRK